jgi:hypothetical protein
VNETFALTAAKVGKEIIPNIKNNFFIFFSLI